MAPNHKRKKHKTNNLQTTETILHFCIFQTWKNKVKKKKKGNSIGLLAKILKRARKETRQKENERKMRSVFNFTAISNL